MEKDQAADRATLRMYAAQSDQRHVENRERLEVVGSQVGEVKTMLQHMTWYLLGGVATVLMIVLGHDLLHIG